MSLSNLYAWSNPKKTVNSSACGSACGSGDKAMPTACGSACGSGDKAMPEVKAKH